MLTEYDSKNILKKYFKENTELIYIPQNISITSGNIPNEIDINSSSLIVKSDQLIKRRGKNNLLKPNITYDKVIDWIKDTSSKTINIDDVSGTITNFIVEEYIHHEENEEYYISIVSLPDYDEIKFYHQGGVNISTDIENIAETLIIKIEDDINTLNIKDTLLKNITETCQQLLLEKFIRLLYNAFANLHFTFLEINPFCILNNLIYILDIASILDMNATYICSDQWGTINQITPFGTEHDTEEESYIKRLDLQTGASLKFRLLNPYGKIWPLVAGGGASVIYTDKILELGYGHELANYGEYSGSPEEYLMYEYTKTILSVMTKHTHISPKVLLIGGAIAQMSNINITFQGIIRALEEYVQLIKKQSIKIFVRRSGPDYKKGLNSLLEFCNKNNITSSIYDHTVKMTYIVDESITYLNQF